MNAVYSASRLGPVDTREAAPVASGGTHLPPTRWAIAAFAAFGLSSSGLIAATGTIADTAPADAESMTLGIKTVVALVVFTVVSTFTVAGIYFGLLFAFRSERAARKALERRVAKLEWNGRDDGEPKRDALGNAMNWENET